MTSRAFSEEAPRPWLRKTVADWPVNAPNNLFNLSSLSICELHVLLVVPRSRFFPNLKCDLYKFLITMLHASRGGNG
jgi:hypothetical protein